MDKYWTSLEDKNKEVKKVSHVNRNKGNGDSLGEILNDSTLNAPSSRRDFLKLFGYSIATATIVSACEQPVRKAIPYLIAPEEITPGKASYYASTFFDGQDYCSILVKVRDGRPIKIEGNELSPVTKGGTSARVQASVLGLYDDARFTKPLINNKESDWKTIDLEIINQLNALVSKGKEIILITPTIISPSTKAVIQLFISKYKTVKHIQYDTVSSSGMLEANKDCFGYDVIPSYRFDNAEVIVSFAADFLGTWLSPVEFTKQYSKTRSLTEGQKKISKHIQFESGLSLTGSNADLRIPVKPSQEKIILINLYNAIAKETGSSTTTCPESPVEISEVVNDLLNSRGKSLVISGSNDPEIQIIVNAINQELGNYNSTIDLQNPILHRQGRDSEITSLLENLKSGEIGGIIFYDVNPIYDYPQADILKEYVEKLDMVVSLTSPFNETSALAHYTCPDHNFLESWNDAEIKPGIYSLAQPSINPLFNTRQAQDSLLVWSGNNSTYNDFIKEYWKEKIFIKSGQVDFFKFWNKCLESGVYEIANTASIKTKPIPSEIFKSACENFENETAELEISFYEKVGPGSGKHANNPWLQEMPDPVTRSTWDNYLCISPKYAEEKGWKSGDIVKINDNLEIPVLVQPGQAYGTVSVAIGYGRKISGKVAEGVGVNVFPLVTIINEARQNNSFAKKIEKTGSGHQFALTQTHHSMEGRAIIREAHLDEYNKVQSAGNEMHAEYEEHNQTLYKDHPYPGHHWGMAIDLNKCIGCSACVVACSVENNVPVVGKPEVLRTHEMHWIRIDRYYKGTEDNPQTVRQPVMCQHCDDAPCENVCPVAATNHSDEGINQMAYNRCIGTRYCNNNCPYKVRRFNWFDYTTADAMSNNTVDYTGMTLDLKRMVLNPDVTVRAKGVMEKCSFCIQRIQASKLDAKTDNRMLSDGDIRTACQQACPAEAIVFGDVNDPESRVSKLFKDPRNYNLLEELHTLPSVGYLTKISKRKQEV